MTRIGPRMIDAVSFVADKPGCPILPVAEHVGPNGSRQYGYRTVHRAIEAGLLEHRPADDAPANVYRLFVTEAGRAALDS